MLTTTTEKRFTEKETAQILGLSPMTVRRRRENGELGFYKAGRRVLISEKHIADYLAACERSVKPTIEADETH
ncbi:MAG TPA: helix-turn-helix domain-containing protein [Pyrinomonadaceae bacterium]|jgi:excisionase family DNA binding protein